MSRPRATHAQIPPRCKPRTPGWTLVTTPIRVGDPPRPRDAWEAEQALAKRHDGLRFLGVARDLFVFERPPTVADAELDAAAADVERGDRRR